MLGTHVWRTEDAMAAFNLPQKYHAYYSTVVNHCMFPPPFYFNPLMHSLSYAFVFITH
jgi:hypothetical protein